MTKAAENEVAAPPRPEPSVLLDDIPDVVGMRTKVMPTGWFQMAWSDEIAVGDVRPLKYFNKDLVLYRTEDGKAIVQSAFCPHMGAHLGHGGHVEGCHIVCPYHGWRWGTDGRNALVPSEGEPSPTNRKLKTYPVAETNGIIWAWHDALHREPLWPAPEELRGNDDFLPIYPHCIRKWEAMRVQPQYVVENTVDVDHLIFVHKSNLIPVLAVDRTYPEYIEDGHIWRNQRELPLQSSYFNGLGVIVAMVPRDPAQPHRIPSYFITGITPIDNEHSDFFGTVLVGQDPDADPSAGDVPVGRAAKRIERQMEQAVRDVPIWDNMVYLNRPAYTRAEGPLFMKLRRFTDKFYPKVSE
jgi:nitrite reductase/ring-hydroxylating ferredoxin subunit